MLAYRLAQERSILIVIDRLRTGETRVAEIGKVRQKVASVVVERDHKRVVIRREPIQQNAAWIKVIDVSVPHGKKRRDRFDRRMSCARQKEGGSAEALRDQRLRRRADARNVLLREP